MSEQNLLKAEYERLGGPKLSENASKFLETLWQSLRREPVVSVYDATIMAGFEDDGDEEMFFPFCARLVSMGLLSAHTELTRDVTRTEVVAGSRKDGVRYADPSFGREGYSEEELAALGVDEGDGAFALVYVSPSGGLRALMSGPEADEEKEDEEPEAEEPKAEGPEVGAENAEGAFAVGLAAEPSVGIESHEGAPDADLAPSDDSSRREINEQVSPSGVEAWRGEGRVARVLGKSERPKAKLCEVFDDPEQGVENVDAPAHEEDVSLYNLKKNWRPMSGSTAAKMAVTRAEILRCKDLARGGDEEALDSLSDLFRAYEELKVLAESGPATPVDDTTDESAEHQNSASEAPASGAEAGAVEPPSADPTRETADEEASTVASSEVTIGQGAARAVLGRTRAKLRRIGVVSLGAIVASTILYISIREKNKVEELTNKMAAHLDDPATEYRLVKRAEIEAMQDRAEQLAAQNSALIRERDAAIRLEIEKHKKSQEETIRGLEKRAYEKGRSDATGLSPLGKERIASMSLTHAVINGECDAFGRGNRVDKIFPSNLPVRVMYWIIEPTQLKISGVVGVSEDLLTRSDGPVTQIRCLVGKADVWPSRGEPKIGPDGHARPLAEDGRERETNPLLQ